MTGYAFQTTDNIPTQLDLLQHLCDPTTMSLLARLALPAEARCWEIGAGAGSIAQWLALDPHRQVTATDIDTIHLDRRDPYEIITHDLTTDRPLDGPWHLIHARNVLLHLPTRQTILRQLVEVLAPGGWLVIEEFDCTTPGRVLTCVDPVDAQLFLDTRNAILATLRDAGASMTWAYEVFAAMTGAGLTDVHTTTRADAATAASVGAHLYAVNAQQLADRLIAHGVSQADLDAFAGLMQDPTFAAMSYPLVSTCGRKPATT